MARKTDPADLNHAVALYQSGKSPNECRAITGISGSVLYRALRARGIPSHERRHPVPHNLVADYLAGESVKALSIRHGIDRNAVYRMLTEAGVATRNRSEAMYTRVARMSPEDRRKLSEAAHRAALGRAATDAERIKVAAAKHGRVFSPNETLLVDMLALVDLPAELGVACGRYNIDVLAGDTVAVEIFGGGWHAYGRHRAIFAERSRYILDAGYALVIVWVDQARYPLGLKCAQHIVTLAEAARCDPAMRRQYWVIRGDGHILAALPDDGHEVPFIRASGRGNYSRPAD